MNEEETHGWQRWKARVFVAGVGLLAGVVLASTRGDVGRTTGMVFGGVTNFLGHVLTATPTLLVGALLYATHRKSGMLWGVLICAGVNIAAGTLIEVMGYSVYAREAGYFVLSSVRNATSPYYAVPMMLLAAHHFRGMLERVRIATMVLIVLAVLANVGLYFVGGDWYSVLDRVLYCALPLALMVAAWCLAFRQVRANRPPADAGREVLLVCPRCQVQQTVKAGHGECVHCRLQITISLDEGVCGKCGYRRRGLTGGRCPECGEAFAEAARGAEEGVAASSAAE